MPVNPRGNSWEATVNFKGQRYRKTFPSRSQAEKWEADTKAALLRGEIISDVSGNANPGPQTMKQLYDLTYQRYWKGAKAEKSSSLNGRKCIEALGEHLPPSLVDERRLDEMIFMFEKEGLSDSTINRRLAAISKMLTFAYERGYIPRRPKIERKQEPEHRIRYLGQEEEQVLLDFMDAIEQPDMVDIIKLGIDTGMRLGEIRDAEARDLSEGLISIWRTKGRKARSIPLTERAQEVFERRAKEYPVGKLFPGWTHSMIRHYWDTARSHMGLMRDPQFVPHAMRHTFCSRLVQAGVDITTISKLAGHSSVVVTMKYAHLAPHNLRNAIRKLENKSPILPAEDMNPLTRATPQACGILVA